MAAVANLYLSVSGLLLEHFYWGSMSLIMLPLAEVAIFMAWRFVPAHVNDGTERVDNLGGVLSLALARCRKTGSVHRARHASPALDSRVAPREEAGVANFDDDGVVIGWGFGGAVAALGAVERG